MTIRSWRAVGLLIGALSACSSAASTPPEPEDCERCEPEAGTPPPADAGPRVREAAAPTGMEPRAPLSVQLSASGASRACGDCAVITARPSGGELPYALRWSDERLQGVGPHEVCDPGPARYEVTVSDGSGGVRGDIGSAVAEPMRASASVDLPCEVQDAGASFTGCKVLLNAHALSFLDPTPSNTENVFGCAALDGGAGVPADRLPADGGTGSMLMGQYVAMEQPMRAGHSYAYQFELRFPLQLGGDLRMELWGSREGCSLDEKLGVMSVVNGTASEVCLSPHADFDKLLATPSSDSVNPLFAFSLGVSMTLCARCAGL